MKMRQNSYKFLCLILVLTFAAVFIDRSLFQQKLTDFGTRKPHNRTKTADKREQNKLSHCRWKENRLAGKLYVNKDQVSLDALRKEEYMNKVESGGEWKPSECKARSKVAIIIPFRKREHHLPILLRQLHPILQRQSLHYRIFIINQTDDSPFNRGKLLNTGFKEALAYDNFQCFVFHDVDLIPEDDRNDYGCPSSPRHMCPAVSKFNYQLFSPILFGGVTAFTKDDFMLINGYSNKYWGWGAEDDDCHSRFVSKKLKLTRPVIELGRYTALGHSPNEMNEKRLSLLRVASERMDKDGLSTLNYATIERQNFELFTKISVDLLMTSEEKNLTTVIHTK